MDQCFASELPLAELAKAHGTPFWVYDLREIERRIRSISGFDIIRYAQKANSNIHILAFLRSLGVFVDAVSLGEIERALAAGYSIAEGRSEIVYASDVLDGPTLRKIVEHKIPINVGSPQMLSQLGEVSPGHPVWLRINPGFGSGFSQKTNTGGENSKHGIWHENLDESYGLISRYDLRLVGLHMHIGSGADFKQLSRVCEAMTLNVRRCPFDVHAISVGGGLPVPYREDEREIDIAEYQMLWAAARSAIESHLGHAITLEIEPGRYVVSKAGILVSEVRATKKVGSNTFALLDAGFNDLIRPAMYGSYHKISIFGDTGQARRGNLYPTVVAGPLCEAGDVFTQGPGGVISRQNLPATNVGDLAIFHDCGAYSSSMSSNYNSRPLAPEFLWDGNKIKMIRRRQKFEELLALELV